MGERGGLDGIAARAAIEVCDASGRGASASGAACRRGRSTTSACAGRCRPSRRSVPVAPLHLAVGIQREFFEVRRDQPRVVAEGEQARRRTARGLQLPATLAAEGRPGTPRATHGSVGYAMPSSTHVVGGLAGTGDAIAKSRRAACRRGPRTQQRRDDARFARARGEEHRVDLAGLLHRRLQARELRWPASLPMSKDSTTVPPRSASDRATRRPRGACLRRAGDHEHARCLAREQVFGGGDAVVFRRKREADAALGAARRCRD
jgi:hypothetical protein